MRALSERRPSAGVGRGRIGGALVAFQVALCLVLVVGAGLFVRTFASLAGRYTGVDRDRILVVGIDAKRSAQASSDRRVTLFNRVVAAVRAQPGVAEAAFSAVTPVSDNTWDTLIENPAGLALSEADRRVYRNDVSPSWFATYGIPVIAGRDFTGLDQSPTPTVAIVNEAFARRYFPGRNPIGQTIREVGSSHDQAPALAIVGVVKDAVYVSLREVPAATMFLPAQFGTAVSVRADGVSPAAIASTVRAAIAGVDRDLALTTRPLADDFALFVARERILALLGGFFGALALLLSAIGLYGVVSYGVGARRAEIGTRVALGATPFRVVVLAVRRVAILVSLGLAVGVPVSVWSARSVSALLFGFEPSDPRTYFSAVAVLLTSGVAAAWVPARRAARMNPAITLRAD